MPPLPGRSQLEERLRELKSDAYYQTMKVLMGTRYPFLEANKILEPMKVDLKITAEQHTSFRNELKGRPFPSPTHSRQSSGRETSRTNSDVNIMQPESGYGAISSRQQYHQQQQQLPKPKSSSLSKVAQHKTDVRAPARPQPSSKPIAKKKKVFYEEKLLGCAVERVWDGKVHAAIVTDYNPAKDTYTLTYSIGKEGKESYEEYDMNTLPSAVCRLKGNEQVDLWSKYPKSAAVANSKTLKKYKPRNIKPTSRKMMLSEDENDDMPDDEETE